MSDISHYNIEVDVKTLYIAEQSNPEQNRYVFAYTITIENKGDRASRLLTRRWLITDANNKTQEVFGEGVVGKQPYLNPGEGFQYTSAAMIETPVGSMEGSYQMVADDGHTFDTIIPAFSLALPQALH